MDNEMEALSKELRRARGPFMGTPNANMLGTNPSNEERKPEPRIKETATRKVPEPEKDKRAYPGDPIKSALSDAMDKYLK